MERIAFFLAVAAAVILWFAGAVLLGGLCGLSEWQSLVAASLVIPFLRINQSYNWAYHERLLRHRDHSPALIATSCVIGALLFLTLLFWLGDDPESYLLISLRAGAFLQAFFVAHHVLIIRDFNHEHRNRGRLAR